MTGFDVDLPRIFAHRGASAVAPENTLPAFEAAAAIGARAVEFDVSLLGDGTAVIHHDGNFARCTNREGALAEASHADLATLDAGAWFADAFRGAVVPELGAALDCLATLGLAANLEIKLHGADPARFADTVAEALAARPTLAARTVVSSFDHAALEALARVSPDQPLAALWSLPPSDWRARMMDMGAGALHTNWRKLTPATLEEAAETQIPVRVYTCNDPAELAPFRPLLSAVITDDPRLFFGDPDWAEWAT